MAVSPMQCPVCGIAIHMATIPNDCTPFTCFRCLTPPQIVKANRTPVLVVSICVAVFVVIVTHVHLAISTAIFLICYGLGRFVQVNVVVPKIVPSKVAINEVPKAKKIHLCH